MTDNFNGIRIDMPEQQESLPALRTTSGGGPDKQKKCMKTKFNDLITSVDILNTVHGGVSEPFLSIRELSGGREMRVRVPGVEKEALKLEIVNNQLSVFYLIPIYSAGRLMHLPQVIYNQPIPYFIDANKIEGTYEENELVVVLPFNELSGGYKRKIKIV